MRFLDEYRDGAVARRLIALINAAATRRWTIMEICGGQTHAIMRYGIEPLIGENVTLVHGPGCPVCVTPVAMIDRAVSIASKPGVILASFGDMLRVPGSRGDLLGVKARGGDVRIVYSPLDAVALAGKHPDRKVVFFAVGFETTAPANAMAVLEAHGLGLVNFSILCSHVTVPPALDLILASEPRRIQGVLAAGHVCTVMGYEEYYPLCARHGVPVVVTGFEPVDILQGIAMTVKQLEEGRAEVENQYGRVVRRGGNIAAREAITKVFRVADREWRGIGTIPDSGYVLRRSFQQYDAEFIFPSDGTKATESPLCRAGQILRGMERPSECPAFGRECTPESPLGAPMVSSEGACAAYYHYSR